MLPIFLQFFAVFEYLLSSCVPGVIVCTCLSAIQHIVESSGANVFEGANSLYVYQRLILLQFVEYAITGVSDKLKRPNDDFVFNLMRLLYLIVIWCEASIVFDMVNIAFLKNIFKLQTLLALLFVAISVFVQLTGYNSYLPEYRALASRLSQFWNFDIKVYLHDEDEEEDEEEEDAVEQGEKKE